MRFRRWNNHLPMKDVILGTTCIGHVVSAWRQHNELTAMPIDLIVEEKVRFQASRSGGIHTTSRVADHELSGRRCAIVIQDLDNHFDSWAAFE